MRPRIDTRDLLSQVAATLAVCASLMLPSPACANPVLSVVSNAQVADGVSVSIQASGLTDLTSFQFDLDYDPLRLQLASFTDAGTDFEAAAIAAGGTLLGLTGISAGSALLGAADAMIGALSGLAPSGSLLTLNFRILSSGTSQVRLSNVFVTDAGVVLDSTGVTTTDGTVFGTLGVPEPNALLLVLLALSACALVSAGRSTAGGRSTTTEVRPRTG